MTHDPLCPSLNCIDSNCSECCACTLIAKVRADERKRHMMGIPEYGSGSWSSGSTTSGTQITWQ